MQATLLALVALLSLLLVGTHAVAAPLDDDELPRWHWPSTGDRVIVEPFRAPAHVYGAGHRGVDLRLPVGSTVVAPAAGTVAFRGTVVDRPVLTIEHADDLVTTFEPVLSTLNPGDAVAAEQKVGVVVVGGHTPTGALHLGVRRAGVYINPLLLFGPVPRAILLPCCEAF